ncbi:MAG: DUF1553 domain-containing protein, partial [Verrucomicrobiales bacterium]|nr:DUF1553 domain-containing protein [Verrucomicrobiales bacterium]
RLLVEKLQVALVIPNQEQPASVQEIRAEVDELSRAIEILKSKMIPPLTIRALWDRGEPSPTYTHRRGNPTSPGRLVGPGVPAVLTDGRTPFKVIPPFPDGTPKTGRRLAFATWLTEPEHPLTARVMVNRIWYHHFGRGLVGTLENFGLQSEPPSHPELLDWLALEFMKNGWSVKEMHRVMMNSRTWKQSSRVLDDHLEKDPDNLMYSRMPLRRLDAEALRDSLLFVSGKLDPAAGGPPDGVSVDREGAVMAKVTANGKWRRSVYMQYRRTEIPTMMAAFDYPEMGPNCVSRSTSTVSPQSLLLMNNKRVRHLAGAFAERIESKTPSGQVNEVYRLALSREPTPREKKLGVETLTKLKSNWSGDGGKALAAYCHALLNSAAFLYVD